MTILDGFTWEGNNARISGTLHDVAPGDEPSDVIELTIRPGDGEEKGWYMNLEDALAVIAILSRLAFMLQIGDYRLEGWDDAPAGNGDA